MGPGNIARSADGVRWQVSFAGTDQPLFAVAWGDGQFVAAGSKAYSSANGRDWADAGWQWSDNRPLRALAWGQGKWVAAGWSDYEFSGYIYAYEGGELFETAVISAFPEAVLWHADTCLVVGWGDYDYVSADGQHWTEQKSGTLGRLTALVRGQDQVVAVSEEGAIFVSRDGQTWTKSESGISEALNGIAWSGSQYIAVGDKRHSLFTRRRHLDPAGFRN